MQWTGIDHDPDSDIAFHVSSPQQFRPVRGKRNFLYTFWESQDLPEKFRPYLWNADLLITSSKFCADVFEGKVACPIKVVPLGMNPQLFTRVKRVWQPGDSFQWLQVGAPNARKGWDVIEDVWNKHFLRDPRCHLYCKLTAPYEKLVFQAKCDGYSEHSSGVVYRDNIILDFRHLKIEELVETYHRSHGFLFPTAAEGFGLSLLEAMATSLPCIVTEYSGVLDFTSADTVAYVPWTPHLATETQVGTEKAVINSVVADTDSVISKMETIMGDYRSALKMGRRAAQVAQSFTWESTGKRVAEIIRQYM